VFTTLELKFHLVLEPRGILLETQSSTERHYGDREKKAGIPDRLLKTSTLLDFVMLLFPLLNLTDVHNSE
jgi:hypothetical protein